LAICGTTWDWVWDHFRSRHGARLTLVAIAYYGEVVTISIRELCDMTLLSERAVRMAICNLVEFGELAVEYNAGDSSRYRVLMPDREPEPGPPAAPKRKPIPPRIRLFVYERDGYRCVRCGSVENLTIDHIHPWILGGADTADNLQALCRSCNCRKGARV